MKRSARILLVVSLFILGLLQFPVMAQTAGSGCVDGLQKSGAVYRICMPSGFWNRDLVVYAHGYVSPFEPIGIPEDQLYLPDGTSIPEIINGLGYAFATTSYSKNGLAVVEGIEDVLDLVDIFKVKNGDPRRIYLVGASEGGLVTALAVENFPDVFDGGMALCGPIGDFRRQVNYWGDFKVVFDYFFPNILPGNPVYIPLEIIENWASYELAIANAVLSNPHATEQLLRVTGAPIDPGDPDSILETVLGILWYNVFATNDAIEELDGRPFDNKRHIYLGSDNDFRLNLLVKRFSADPKALAEIAANYQTTGYLESPLVTLHNTTDPIVPYWHETLYRWKVFTSGSSFLHSNIPILRYGHCNFKASEALAGFALLVLKVAGQELFGAEAVLPDANALMEFWDLMKKHRPAR